MVRCPICESVQIGYLVSPRPTSCYYCKATWLQEGGEQTAVRAASPHRDEVLAPEHEPDLPSAYRGRTEWAPSSA
jgi:ribosomal protein S27E